MMASSTCSACSSRGSTTRRARRADVPRDLEPGRRRRRHPGRREGAPSSGSSTCSSTGSTRDPAMHVYHYAAYEKTALGRLAQRHATREEEVDRLLRGRVLVDLYRVVRQGVRASVESYSIKRLEAAVRARARGRAAGAPARASSRSRRGSRAARPRTARSARRSCASIAGYNRDDVLSNWQLRDWLEARRLDLGRQIGAAVPAPADRGRRPRHARALTPAQQRVADLVAALTAGCPRRRSGRIDRSSTAAGCSRSCSTGTGARTRRSGGASSSSPG